MSNLYRGPSIDASYKVSFHLSKRFQRKRFFTNRLIRNKNSLWWPCLLTDQNEMINLYRGPSIDASYKVSVHLAKQFQMRSFFRNQPIRNKNRLWRPCLLTDRDEMSNLYREHSIDASYHVSVHLVMRFHRRRFFKNSANQKQELPVVAMFVNGSGQDVQPLERTFHKCFLPSFSSFG